MQDSRLWHIEVRQLIVRRRGDRDQAWEKCLANPMDGPRIVDPFSFHDKDRRLEFRNSDVGNRLSK